MDDPAFGNGGTLFTANESTPYAEDCPVLRTTVSGVTAGTYDVFAYFWSRPAEDWRLAAGFSAAQTIVFRRYSSQQAEPVQFDAAVTTVQGGA